MSWCAAPRGGNDSDAGEVDACRGQGTLRLAGRRSGGEHVVAQHDHSTPVPAGKPRQPGAVDRHRAPEVGSAAGRIELALVADTAHPQQPVRRGAASASPQLPRRRAGDVPRRIMTPSPRAPRARWHGHEDDRTGEVTGEHGEDGIREKRAERAAQRQPVVLLVAQHERAHRPGVLPGGAAGHQSGRARSRPHDCCGIGQRRGTGRAQLTARATTPHARAARQEVQERIDRDADHWSTEGPRSRKGNRVAPCLWRAAPPTVSRRR
jgi:hypothetical protein